MLLAHDSWEAVNGSAVSSGMSGDNLIRYRRVHVPVNVQLFHINVGDSKGGLSSRTRFIVDDPNELIDLLNEFLGREISVTLQSELNENSEYELCGVDSITRVFCSSGNIYYRFLCDDGVLRLETFARVSSGELVREEAVWTRE